LAVHFSNVYS